MLFFRFFIYVRSVVIEWRSKMDHLTTFLYELLLPTMSRNLVRTVRSGFVPDTYTYSFCGLLSINALRCNLQNNALESYN